MKVIIAVFSIFTATFLFSACSNGSGDAAKREQARPANGRNVSDNSSAEASSSRTSNSTDVSVSQTGGKRITVKNGDSTVEIGKDGINIKTSGDTRNSGEDSEVSGSGEEIVINTNDERRTINCGGGEVAVTGSDNNLTLRNRCTLVVAGGDNTISVEDGQEIKIAGSDNKVSIQTARIIKVSGSNNHVTWTKGGNGEKPEIADVGSHNVISQTAE